MEVNDSKFDPRVIAFVDYYSKHLYDILPVKTFAYNEEESLKIIKSVMLITLEQCVTSISPITKEKRITMEINEEFARIILEMEYVCYSEGIGPNNDELLRLIFKEFPNLIERYKSIYEMVNV